MKKNFDAYSQYCYKKKLKKQSKKGTFLAVFFVIFCLFVIIFFSISFSNFLIVGKVVNNNSTFMQSSKTLYALSLSSHQNSIDAENNSKIQQSQGGAGYVLKIGQSFKVISSIYSSKKDCEKVIKNLNSSQINAEIVEIVLPAINLNINLNSSSNEILKNALNLFYKNYEILYNLSTEFDKQNIDSIKLKSSIKSLENDNLKVINNYSTYFQQSTNVAILYTKIYLSKINSVLENLLNSDDSINLSSNLKHTYCQIVCLYQSLCAEIS